MRFPNRYDGVDMPALDIDNYSSVRPEAVSSSLSAISQSLDDLVGQSGSYSDNEKQLLEQMKKMRCEFKMKCQISLTWGGRHHQNWDQQ